MNLEIGHYYHLYNRSNNRELLFKKKENYLYFLRKFRKRFEDSISVFAYCLMPTYFHFLLRVDTDNTRKLRQDIGIHLSSYTKAINKVFERNGSLFQAHTKSKIIDDRNYLITLLSYIHQNPIRAGLVKDLRSWSFSSYPDLAGYRNGTLVNQSLIEQNFKSVENFRLFSNQAIAAINKKYWIQD